MDDKIKLKLYEAIIRILKPLVRILLANGIAYGTFSELAKWTYVDVATKDFKIGKRKQTISRISVITGLTRKEVKKMHEMERPEHTITEEKLNRAARAVSGWRRDENFTDKRGEPLVLPDEGGEISFTGLVRRYCGDLPVRAVMDELLCSGTITRERNGDLRLVSPVYLPKKHPEMKIYILGREVSRLISTIGHNLDEKEENNWLQRTVAYDNLPKEAIPRFRNISQSSVQKLLKKLDRWLAEHDRDANPDTDGTGRCAAGVGVYYFEEPADKENSGS